ncbi:hypothetical protein DKU39_06405 [Salmonella enterica subsp. houtenae]|nr:hypothetical protein [Salmonella enterica subsp. houtenae]
MAYNNHLATLMLLKCYAHAISRRGKARKVYVYGKEAPLLLTGDAEGEPSASVMLFRNGIQPQR